MIVLALERSTPHPSAALMIEGRLAAHRFFATPTDPRRDWIPEVADMLRDAAVHPAALTQIVVGLGPGSFTGIRSALAWAQGLALPGDIPVRGISSAAVLARAVCARMASSAVVVLGDARRDQLWIYRHRPALRPRNDLSDFTICDWNSLASHLAPGDSIVSPDWDRVGPRLLERFPGFEGPRATGIPDARIMAEWAVEDASAFSATPHPLYPHPAV